MYVLPARRHQVGPRPGTAAARCGSRRSLPRGGAPGRCPRLATCGVVLSGGERATSCSSAQQPEQGAARLLLTRLQLGTRRVVCAAASVLC
jgi:hypothetical protein